MIKNILGIVVLFLAAVLLSSCSSLIVSQDYDTTRSFEAFATFTFEPKDPARETDSRTDNTLLNKRFYSSISAQLEKKGLQQRSTSASPDLLISYNYTIRPKMDLMHINSQLGFSYGSYHRYGGVSSNTCTDISEFDQGILMVDIKDVESGELIWRGTGTDIISIHATPDMISSQVEKIVEAVLRQFPPG